jgi:type IV secretory pathway VirB2 component (pilin)
MESARPYPFRIILIAILFLGLGFILGYKAVSFKKARQFIGANTIMLKRMQAIEAAQRQGKNTYEFEVVGWHPILGKD